MRSSKRPYGTAGAKSQAPRAPSRASPRASPRTSAARRLWRRLPGRGLWRWLSALALLLLLAPPLWVAAYSAVPPPGTLLMALRWAEGDGWRRDWVPLEAISPNLRLAVLAAEDNRFCGHFGYDWVELERAVADWKAGKGLRGASTITMQSAKNLFLWPGRDWLRKVAEVPFVFWLEALAGKRRILELYLNVAEWAPGVYGAEAAARHHFGVSAEALSGRQGALLAAVLPNPRAWSAGEPGPYVSNRAATLQARVQQLGPALDCAR
ncbi:MAG: monofunctional biosynthetic peptidoglycan transglycosylase [Tistlia sp.]|uniref:monofunctional biosynthetic peptidoglycan transglycosylase n=1 Tax=Tistlia sp. TaxID=3057121 RepID=UPI0034A1DA6E